MSGPSETRPERRPLRIPAWHPPAMVNRMLASQRRERDIILAEVADLRGFMPLLMKHRNGGRWSREERAALHRQFQALRHISPYLVVIILPGSFAMLPVLAWWLDRRRLRRDSASLSMPGA